MHYISILLPLLFCTAASPSAITYEFNGGRFGDCLSTYCKAKWFAYTNNLQLLYKPFTYSDQLNMHQGQTLYSKELEQSYSKIVRVKSVDDIKKVKGTNVLFISNFYSITPGLYEYGLQNKDFGNELKNMLTPINPPPSLEKPEKSVVAAVHVRKGGGFDQQNAGQIWPTKFPPDQYYIEQIIYLRKLIDPEKTLIIYLFTDDPNPALLAQCYAQKLNDASISFMYREKDNSHDANVVEDFYLMSQCDCLIRSSSLFAKAAQLLGNYQIIFYPIHGYWDGNKVIIDPVGITIKNVQ